MSFSDHDLCVFVCFSCRDYADNFLDGGEVESASRSRNSPPIPSATSCLDSHFNPDHLTMESTGNALPMKSQKPWSHQGLGYRGFKNGEQAVTPNEKQRRRKIS